MASELKVDTIKHTNNTSAITLDTSGNVTLAGSANNLGTASAGTLGSSVVFPSGHQVFIKSVTRTGTSGAVHEPTSFYPTATSDFASKSINVSITSSEHSPFTKILVNFSCSFRIDINTHTIIDARLARWTGTGNASSETSLLQQMLGGASTDVDAEHYHCFSGSVVDDISSLGDVQINYLIQYRAHAGNAIHADDVFFGAYSNDKHHMNTFGII